MSRHVPVAAQAKGKGCELEETGVSPKNWKVASVAGIPRERGGRSDIRWRGKDWQEPDHAGLYLIRMGSLKALNTITAGENILLTDTIEDVKLLLNILSNKFLLKNFHFWIVLFISQLF